MFFKSNRVLFEKPKLYPFFVLKQSLSAACNFIKKETLAQVFSYEFCEISKNTFFTEHLRTTASEKSKEK